MPTGTHNWAHRTHEVIRQSRMVVSATSAISSPSVTQGTHCSTSISQTNRSFLVTQQNKEYLYLWAVCGARSCWHRAWSLLAHYNTHMLKHGRNTKYTSCEEVVCTIKTEQTNKQLKILLQTLMPLQKGTLFHSQVQNSTVWKKNNCLWEIGTVCNTGVAKSSPLLTQP